MLLTRLRCYIINSICCLLYQNEYKKFINIQDIAGQQRQKLLAIMKANKDSDYGQKYGFASVQDVQEYQRRVPITTYEDYAQEIARIEKADKNVLTAEDVFLLEPTSGSSSAVKLVPYTKSLRREFQNGLKPWIFNLYSGVKGIKWGKSYWSVTPAVFKNTKTEGGIPIGFEEDSAYFGRIEKKLINAIFAVPENIAREQDMESFYFNTALSLIKCRNLTFISVWNPTFLLLLIEYMETNVQKLAAELSSRRVGKVIFFIEKKAYTKLWPHLKVISCWCDANAKPQAYKLEKLFAGVRIQPKGLLLTEGFISLPFLGEVGARLSYRSHFFEFESLSDGRLYLAHELIKDNEYEVIITTSGGLYRYRTNDVIRVTNFVERLPLMKFMGRRNLVSDLFGEKINEQFIKRTMEKLNVNAAFYMVAPEIDRYVLYIMADRIPNGIDEALRENFHYDYCRKLSQLKELRVYRLTGNPWQEYLEQCVRLGQRLGNIKPVALHRKSGWDQVFKGEYL